MSVRRKRRRPDPQKEERESGDDQKVKIAKPVNSSPFAKPKKLLQQVINNPNLSYQVMVILLSLTSDSVKMESRISNMSTSLDNIRGAAEVLNTSVRSLQAAAEAPKRLRRLFNPDDK